MVDELDRSESPEIILCRLDQESYALEMSWVRSVARADRLRQRTEPEGLVGVLSEGGREVPVFSLRNQLGRKPACSERMGHVVMLSGEPAPLALLVDHLSSVVRIDRSHLLNLPAPIVNSSARYFRGAVRLGQELALLLAPDRMFPAGSLQRNGCGSSSGDEVPTRSALPLLRSPSRTSGGPGQIVIFSTTEPEPRKRPLSFGLSIAEVLEILDPPPLIPVPGAPHWVLGLVLWHDHAVAVIDLPRRMGLPPAAAGDRARLLIARASIQSEPIGLLVRPSVRIRPLPLPHLPCRQPLPDEGALCRGAVELKNETLVIPDLAGV
jgi:purine-binding chemotaxis protein CheW